MHHTVPQLDFPCHGRRTWGFFLALKVPPTENQGRDRTRRNIGIWESDQGSDVAMGSYIRGYLSIVAVKLDYCCKLGISGCSSWKTRMGQWLSDDISVLLDSYFITFSVPHSILSWIFTLIDFTDNFFSNAILRAVRWPVLWKPQQSPTAVFLPHVLSGTSCVCVCVCPSPFPAVRRCSLDVVTEAFFLIFQRCYWSCNQCVCVVISLNRESILWIA